jgi:protein TonB
MSDAGTIPQTRFGAAMGDPFAQLLALEEADRRRIFISYLVAAALYAGGLGGFMRSYDHALRDAAKPPMELEIPVEPPPPPPPPPPEPEPEPEKAKAPPPPAGAPPPPPPAAAQAGKVLTAEADPDAPLDLTNSIVEGTADTFAGGVTASNGTSKNAVYDPNAIGNVPVAPVTKPGPPVSAVDLSRRADPTSKSWDHCGFPQDADLEQVNYGRVTLVVNVGADGKASSATVVKDPGFGFGALAQRCALRERFQPALNKAGQAAASTLTMTINFRR